MSFLDALSSGLTTATQAAGAEQQGEAQGRAAQQKTLLERIALMRQASQDADTKRLRDAQIGNFGSEVTHRATQDDALRNPKPGTKTVIGPNGEVYVVNTTDATSREVTAPSAPPVPSATPSQGAATPPPITPPAPRPTLRTAVKNIDPNSPAGIAAANKKAQGAAQAAAAAGVEQAVDPASGRATYVRRSEAPGMSPLPKTGSGSASLAPEDRAKMLAQAKIDNETMKQIEAKWKAAGEAPGAIVGSASAIAGMHSGMGGVAAPWANKVVGALDPTADLQTYNTALASYGRLMGNLQSKRYSDTQAQIETAISGSKGADLLKTIEYKQRLRDASINDPEIQPSVAGAGGRTGGAGTPQRRMTDATPEQQLWDAAVAKHGKDTVLREYGPRP